MARYTYRFAVLGPTALSPVQVDAAVGPAFERLGFATSEPVITEVKGLAPAQLVPASGDSDSYYIVNVPGWGEVPLDNTPAAGAVRVLTKAAMTITGTLPPAGARAPRAQVSDAVSREVNANLGPLGFFNLTGASMDAGFADETGGSGSIWPYALTAAVVGGLFAWLGETR